VLAAKSYGNSKLFLLDFLVCKPLLQWQTSAFFGCCMSPHLDLPVMLVQTKSALGLFVSRKCEGYESYWK